MSKAKDNFNEYWVGNINKLLTKLNLETITPEDFTNLMVQNTENSITISILCKTKILVLNLNDSTKKFTGGWKHF